MRYCPICETSFEDHVRRCPTDDVRTLVVDEGMTKFVGRVLDQRWRLLNLIGEGGMGAVFEGRQISVERPVAVKLIRAEFAKEELIVSRFFREAKVMSTLQHPNIITMLDFGQDEATGALYLVMELLRGKPLSQLLEQRHQFTLAEVVQLGEQLAGALAEAHGQNIIHRDLKPDNLFVDRVQDRGLHLTLLDFGIARVDDNKVTKLTRTGAIQGTPTYMAPEQVEGVGILPQTDLYAVGVILYEIIAGHEPFRGEGLMQILMAHLTTPPPDLATNWALAEPVCPSLVAVVHRLLQKSPEDRYADAIELLRDLQSIQASLGEPRDLGFAATLDPAHLQPFVRPVPSGPMRLPSGTAVPVMSAPPSPSAAESSAPPRSAAPPPARDEWSMTSADPPRSAAPTVVPPTSPARRSGAIWFAVAAAVLLLAVVGVGGTWALSGASEADPRSATSPPSGAAPVAPDAPVADSVRPPDPAEHDLTPDAGAQPSAQPDASAVAEAAPPSEPHARRRRTNAAANVAGSARERAPVPPKAEPPNEAPKVEAPPPTDLQKKRAQDLEEELKRMRAP